MADIIELSKSINRVNQNVAAQGNTFRQISGENNRNVTKITKDIGSYFIQQRGSLDNVAESTKQNATAIESLGRKIDNNSNLITQSVSSTNEVARLLATTNNLLSQIAKNTNQGGGLGGALGQAAGAAAGNTGGGLSRAANLAGAFAALGGGTALGVSAMGLMGILNNASRSMGGEAGQSSPMPSSGPGGTNIGGTRTPFSPAAASESASEKQKSIIETANRLGIPPNDLATVISYETGGTFSPAKWGGSGGKYLGLIQFGPNEQRKYGVHQNQSFTEQMKAVEKFLIDRGFKRWLEQNPNASDQERRTALYSTINAGSPGQKHWGKSDRPGHTVMTHTQSMFAGDHAKKASNFMSGSYTTQSSPGSTSQSGAPPQQKGALPNSPQTAGDKNQNIPTMQSRVDPKQGVKPQTAAGSTAGSTEDEARGKQGEGQSRQAKLIERYGPGRPEKPDESVLELVRKAAAAAGMEQITATSGKGNYISPSGIAKGQKFTWHSTGKAVDVVGFSNEQQKLEFIKQAKALGAKGVGIYSNGSVHIDLGKERSWNWGYGNNEAFQNALSQGRSISGTGTGAGPSSNQGEEGPAGTGGRAGAGNVGGQRPSEGIQIPGMGGLGGLGGMGMMPGMGMLGMMPGMGMMGGRMGVFGALAGMALGGLGALGSAAAAPSMPSGPTPSTPALQSPQTERGFVSPFANIDESAAQFFAADKLFQNVMKTRGIQAAATNRDVNAERTPNVTVNAPQQSADQQKNLIDSPGRADTMTTALWADELDKYFGKPVGFG